MSKHYPSNMDKDVSEAFLEAVANTPQEMLAKALSYISSNLVPEDVFDLKELEAWADDNGFIKEPPED